MNKKAVKKVIKIEPVSTAISVEKPTVKRVCAYCRVSTGSAEQNNSFEAQVEYYTRLIEEKVNWICAGIYADQARSGTKTSGRDQFQRMLQDCRFGKIDLILTKSVTRFARNTVDSIKVIRELKKLGVEIYFEKERVSTLSEKSEQLLTILSSIAQAESENISTNIRWSIRYRFQNGTFIIGSPAYGYEKDEKGELMIQPQEARIIRKIFDEYLGGKGSYAIARQLRREGIPTIRDSKGWQDSVVKGILQNPLYEGDLLFQKTYTTEGVPFTKKHNHGEMPRYLITDNHAPIITREEAQAVVFMDAIHFHIRSEGRIIKKAVYVAIGIDMSGRKDVLGMYVGENESAKFWLSIMNGLKNRGIRNILIACVDGLSGFPQAIEAVFPETEIQQCIIHQIRNTTKFVSYKDIKPLMSDLKRIYAAPTEDIALSELDLFDEKWGGKYPKIAKSWRDNWANLSTYFKYPEAVRRLIYTTNAIEGFNRQLRKVTKSKTVFPTDDSLLKMLYLATMDITKKWTGHRQDWGQIHSQLEIFFEERLS